MEMLFLSRQSRHSDFDAVTCKVFFPICTLTWRVNNYVSRQEKVKIGETKVQDTIVNSEVLIVLSTHDFIQYS